VSWFSPAVPRQTASGAGRLPVDTHELNLIDEMKARIDSEQGKQIYARRLSIVEPVFANICVQKHSTASCYGPS
jgi:hypothetical protein